MKVHVFFPVCMGLLVVLGCSNPSNSSVKVKLTALQILTGNSAFVKNSANALFQVGQTSPKSSFSSVTHSRTVASQSTLESVTDPTGKSVLLDSAIQINPNYVLLRNLRTEDLTAEVSISILNLTTGTLVPTNYWPDNPSKVSSSLTNAVYVSNGSIIYVELSTGNSEIVNSTYPIWNYTAAGWNDDQNSSWSGATNLVLGPNQEVFAFYLMNFSNSYPTGMGTGFKKINGVWTDNQNTRVFFDNLSTGVGGSFPGSSLTASTWGMIDQVSGQFLQVTTSGTTLTVAEYSLDSLAIIGTPQTFTLSHAINTTTFLGFNNSIQDSVLTDGTSILGLADTGSGITFTETVVPSSIPTSSFINWPGGSVEYYPGGITNWKYLNDQLFYFDPTSSLVYSWDLISSDPAIPVDATNASAITFLY